MINAFLTLCVWLPALIGYGGAVLRPLRIVDPLPPVFSAVIGFAVLATAGNLLHFGTAITPAHALTILVGGWAFFGVGVVSRLWLRRRGHWLPRLHTLSLIAVPVVLLAAALPAANMVINYDAGLYHIGVVKWLTESRLVPGLANLHGRFGFNSAWFSAAALLEIPGWAGKSVQFTNALLYAAYGLALIGVFNRPISRPARLYFALTAPVWLMAASLDTINSHAPDFPILFLTLLMGYLAVEGIGEGRPSRDYAGALGLPSLAWLVAAFALTVKFSAAPLLLIPAGMAVLRRRLALPAAVTVWLIVLIGAWAAHGIALSGCVAYPIQPTCLSVGWAVPPEAVQTEALWVQSWARAPFTPNPQQVMSSWAWLEKWLPEALAEMFNTPFKVALAAFLILAGLLLRSVRHGPEAPYRLTAAIMLIGLVYWFLSAPALRFAHGYLMTLGALGAASGLLAFRRAGWYSRLRPMALIGLMVLAAWGAIPRAEYAPLNAWPAEQFNLIDQRATDQGVVVYTPGFGDQCWAAALPCTPYFSPTLRLQCDQEWCTMYAK